MDDRAKVTIPEGISDVRLVRADNLNAVDVATLEGLLAASGFLSDERASRGFAVNRPPSMQDRCWRSPSRNPQKPDVLRSFSQDFPCKVNPLLTLIPRGYNF